MRAEEKNMVERIMDTETMGYAYEYPYGGGARKEYMLALTRRTWQILSVREDMMLKNSDYRCVGSPDCEYLYGDAGCLSRTRNYVG